MRRMLRRKLRRSIGTGTVRLITAAGLGRLGLAVFVVADLDRGQADPERPLDVEEPAGGQAFARGLDRRVVDRHSTGSAETPPAHG